MATNRYAGVELSVNGVRGIPLYDGDAKAAEGIPRAVTDLKNAIAMSDNATSIALVEAFVRADKPVGAVCHAPVAFVNVRGPDGEYLVKGKHVTGFTNAEEEAVGLTAVVPFLLEDRLKERGGIFSKPANWTPFVQVDRDSKLVTGQNPASPGPGAEELLKLLRPV